MEIVGKCQKCGREFLARGGLRVVPGKHEMYDGRLCAVVNASRTGWWRFNSHYDRDGYCDNPGRGY